MNLHRLLQERAAKGKPVRVGLIGAGKFGSMLLSQVPTTPGLEIAVIADLDPERARAACRTVGWDAARLARTAFIADGRAACSHPDVEVVVEATGVPAAGIAHARAAIAAGKHIVMVNVEADVLAGPAARRRGAVGRRGLFDGLWRPAGADLGAGRLGAQLRLLGGVRRQGHEIPADLSRRDAGRRVGPLRPDRRGGQARRHELADVQLVPRRHQVGDRDGGDRQCLRSRGPGERPRLPALRGRRSAACAAPEAGRRHPRARRHGRGRVVARARRPPGVSRSALGRLCRAQGTQRLCRRLLQAIWPEDRRDRPLCRDVQALPSDRARARHVDPVGGAAPRADRPDPRFPRRRGRGRQARASRPARCSTAKAATRCGASWCRRHAAWPTARCRSGWPTRSS